MSVTKPVVSQKIAVSVQMDTVHIELICGDLYAAQVLYDDLIDRLRAGEGITLSVATKPKTGAPE